VPVFVSQGGPLSSAILYIAIVAIWAFVLVPRWVRRPQTLTAEITAPVDLPQSADVAEPADPGERDTGQAAGSRAGEQRATYPRPVPRSKVLQVRRRLLTMLIVLAVVAGATTYLKLTSWWVCIPPAGMLGVYLLLLREAALADAEQTRWRAAEDGRVPAARRREQVVSFEPTAEVIDISDRLGDQLYDQYADATIRAVGD
jgi:hypothetical protein